MREFPTPQQREANDQADSSQPSRVKFSWANLFWHLTGDNDRPTKKSTRIESYMGAGLAVFWYIVMPLAVLIWVVLS